MHIFAVGDQDHLDFRTIIVHPVDDTKAALPYAQKPAVPLQGLRARRPGIVAKSHQHREDALLSRTGETIDVPIGSSGEDDTVGHGL
jgi:hypothetical protein